MKNTVYKIAESRIAFADNSGDIFVIKIFIGKVEFSCHHIGNDIRSVKAGNNINDGINITVTVSVKIGGEDCAAEADGEKGYLIVTRLLFYHLDIFIKLISGRHRVADKVKGKHIYMVAADFLFNSLKRNHSVKPLLVVIVHLGDGVIPSLCLKIVDMVAVIIAFLN